MKKLTSGMVAIVFGMCLATGPAQADVIEGEIVALNPEEKAVSIQVADRFTAEKYEMKFVVSDDAEWKGAGTLDDLEIGDQVRIAGVENRERGLWEANSLELYEKK